MNLHEAIGRAVCGQRILYLVRRHRDGDDIMRRVVRDTHGLAMCNLANLRLHFPGEGLIKFMTDEDIRQGRHRGMLFDETNSLLPGAQAVVRRNL
ncbi:gp52 [Alphaproteobacteria phage PhiJL001]|uniref:Gp52 n=1 Tax=Alphaproteobacteria phage PhiJL001 TaxID=2681607 RepID=Q5DN53_9CAUD|nr:gp52 [Alphaproteobacteria phage PhiJL001]AAT69528.1 gp52 [Alphaproteobacteria phage PhiJL001]